MSTKTQQELLVWGGWMLLSLIFLIVGQFLTLLNWPEGMVILSIGVGGAALSGASTFPKLWASRKNSFVFPMVLLLFGISIALLLSVLPRYHDYFFTAISLLLLGNLLFFALLLRKRWSLGFLLFSYSFFFWGFFAYRGIWLEDAFIWLAMGVALIVFSLCILLFQLLWALYFHKFFSV